MRNLSLQYYTNSELLTEAHETHYVKYGTGNKYTYEHTDYNKEIKMVFSKTC